jgi:RNA polymerase primary sigma factor
MPDKKAEDIEGQVELLSSREAIKNALKQLPERECKILTMYYGFEGEHTYTLEDIGEDLKLTRERVRQIKERAERLLSRNAKLRNLLFESKEV